MKIDKTFTKDTLKELEGGLVAPDGTIQGAPTAKQVKKTKDELEDDDEQRYEKVDEAGLKLDYCGKCMQMTNHKDKKCQKCKKKNESVNEDADPKVLSAIETLKKVKAGTKRKEAMSIVLAAAKAKTGKHARTYKQALQMLDLEESVNEAKFKVSDLVKLKKPNRIFPKKGQTFRVSHQKGNVITVLDPKGGSDRQFHISDIELAESVINEALYNVGLDKEIEYEKAIGKVVSKLKGIDAYAKVTARYGKAPVNSSANHVYISQYGTVDNTSKLKSILNKLDPNLDVSKLKHNFNASDSSRSKHDQDNDIWKYSIPKKMDWHQAKKAGLLKSNPVKKMDHNVVMSLLDMMAQYTSKQHELANQEWTSLDSFMQHASDFIKGGNWKKFQASVKEKYPMLESVNEAVTKLDVSKLSNSVLISLRKGIDKISRKLNSAEIALFYDLVDEMKKRKIKESHDPFKPEYGTGEVVHDCPKHVEVEGIKGKVVGHTLNEQGNVKYVDIDFGTGKVYKNIRTDKVKILEGQTHQHETKEESTSKTLTKDQLAEIIKEEIKSLDEISGFPNMQKWWKEDPKDVMSFVYWLQKKTPPTGDKWDKAWKGVATHLNKKHKAPSSDFEKIMGESINEAKNFFPDEIVVLKKVKYNGVWLLPGTYEDVQEEDFGQRVYRNVRTKKEVYLDYDDIDNMRRLKSNIQIKESVNEASMKKFSLVKIKVGKHKGEEGRIMVYGGPRKHSVVSLDYGEYNFNPKDLELAESVNRSELKSIIKEEFLNILKEASGGEIFAQFKGTIRKMEAELLNRMDKGGVPEDLEQDVIAVLVKQLSKGNNKISCS
jgi:uncharacterized OB-fold protein